MRIGGIASGMDTEQMVQDLMKAESMRLNKYTREQEALTWQREAFNTTNKKLAEFILEVRKDFGLTKTTSSGTIVSSSKNSFDWVKSANVSNESVATATASANAMSGTHKIKVGQLAEGASVTSQDIKGLLNEDKTFKASAYGDITITTSKGTDTLTIGTNEGEIGNVNDLVSAINNAADGDTNLGLKAAYDKDLGKLMINTKDQGENQNIVIASNATVDLIFGGNISEQGKDAEIWFNESNPDDTNVIKKSSNNFSIYGVNYQLKSEGEITVNVDTNVEGMMEKITGFVDKYNELIDEINGKLGEKEYRDYQPLTSEEKEAMTEKEIELWEEKAKSGLLKNDATLTRTLQSMRSGLYDSVYTDGSNTQNKDNLLPGFSHITQIGITTGNYQSGGKLEIDENKLRAAINDNPEGVVDLLFKTSDTKVDEESADYNDQKAQHSAESGLVNRLFDGMISGMQEVVRVSGPGEDASLFRSVKSNMLIDFVTGGSMSKIDKNIMNIGDRISREERLLASKESRYWSQFTAMEKAMEEMNQQSGWLMSQLGQMG